MCTSCLVPLCFTASINFKQKYSNTDSPSVPQHPTPQQFSNRVYPPDLSMSADRLASNLERITSILGVTTASLQAPMADPQKLHLLETHGQALLDISQKIHADASSFPSSWDRLAREAAATAVSRRLQAAQSSCMTAYVEYLTVAAVALKQQNVASMDTTPSPAPSGRRARMTGRLVSHFGLFLVTYQLTHKCSNLADFLFQTCPSLPATAAIQTAMHSVLSWLLQFLRSGSPALHMLQAQEHGQGQLHEGVLRLMNSVATLLLRIAETPGPLACKALRALPAGLLTTFFCLLCETFPYATFALMQGQGQQLHLLKTTMAVLKHFQDSRENEPFAKIHPEMYTLAALEVAKLAVLVFSTTPDTPVRFVTDCERILCLMIGDFLKQGSTSFQQAVASCRFDGSSMMDSTGSGNNNSTSACGTSTSGSLHSSELNPRVTLSILLVISAIHKHTLRHPWALFEATNLLGCLVVALYHPEMSAQPVACLHLTLHHCTMHIGGWMKGQRAQKQQNANQRQGLMSSQQQEEMAQLQEVLIDSAKFWFTKERIPKGESQRMRIAEREIVQNSMFEPCSCSLHV